jgi:hypothetical protein
MRFIIGLGLALGFLTGGLVPIAGGFSMMSRGVTGDDVLAAFFIGGMLELIGLLILYAVFKTRRNRRGAHDDLTAGIMMATILSTTLNDDGPDGGGDYGD